jgi:Short-chain dehydrogenases of various substrate specificities
MITNKKIVLTGANSGIGLETLKLLVAADNKILAVDLKIDKIDTFDKNKVMPFVCDVSTPENIDGIFSAATEFMGGIDIFFANAGFPYYEKLDYISWERIDKIFKVNTYSPIYTYMKFVEYLNGKPGNFGVTISAMGVMGMPGYSLYGATKFAMQGFQECLRLELPSNVKMTCLYPVATDTGFFKKATEGKSKEILKKPFPVQKPSHVAKCMVKGLEKGKRFVKPCKLFSFALGLFAVLPFVRKIYWKIENNKFKAFLATKETE